MKKGFTLIELLAVIVILAIIAVIAVPIIIDIIDDAQRNTAQTSVKNLEKAAELYYYENEIDKKFEGIIFKCSEGKCKSETGEELKVNGNVPEIGTITIDKEGNIKLSSIIMKGYNCVSNKGNYKCIKSELSSIENEEPVITTITNSVTTSLENFKIYGNSIENKHIEIVDLPDEYQQLDFIEGNGKQYIDTGIIPSNTVKAEVLFELTDATSSQYILGSRIGYSTIVLGLFGGVDDRFFAGTFMGNSVTLGNRQTNSLYKNSLEIEYTEESGYRGKFTLNDLNKNITDSIYTEYSTDGITGENSNIYLFAINSSNVHKGIKVYNSKIWDNGQIVRNFIPCYRKSDGIAGLYELIENKFYTSLGAENFLKGKNVEDAKFSYLGDYDEETQKYKIQVRMTGKNLLDVFYRNQSSLSGTSNLHSRFYEYDKFYVGLTSSNFYVPNQSSYRIEDNSVFVTSKSYGYGIAFPVKVESNTTYSISSVGSNNIISIGEYDSKGNFIQDTSDTNPFTTTKNTKTIIVVLRPHKLNEEIEYKNIQLEEGAEITKYESYRNQTYEIYLDEPLRCIGEVCDYVDFKNQNIVRNVTFSKGILKKMETPKEEAIQLPNIEINEGLTHIMVDNTIEPSKVELKYYK